MRAAKATGERGSWFAKVGGERLPCVHKHWVEGICRSDPGYLIEDVKWTEFVHAIATNKKVILTEDIAGSALGKKSGISFDRGGYIAVFEVADVVADGDASTSISSSACKNCSRIQQ